MESISPLIKTVPKEKLFKLYSEIFTKINDDTYNKLIKDKLDNNIDKENNENMLQIINQLKENINKYPLDVSLYKDLDDNIEIKNKNYILMNSSDNFFIFKSYPSENILLILINNIFISFLKIFFYGSVQQIRS